METVKEKLSKLIDESKSYANHQCFRTQNVCVECPFSKESNCKKFYQAEYLIQNGVTIQKWVSVDEPPKEDGKYLVYFEEGEMCDAIYEVKRGQFRIYNEYWNALNGWFKVWIEANPTHWMPRPDVPQPPKGVQ